MLDRVTVASPCPASWEEMIGNDAIRYCRACRKDVYDLSAMRAEEAEAFLARHVHGEASSACIRLFRRPDGRVLTAECGPGWRRRHAWHAATALTATFAAATVLTAVIDEATQPRPDEEVLGVSTIEPPTMRTGYALGSAAFEVEEVDEHPAVHIDEGALAEAAEPESEILGTASKTARVVAERRAAREPREPREPRDEVLPGVVHLVTPERF